MTSNEIRLLAIAYDLPLIPRYRQLLRHLEHSPDHEQIKQILLKTLEEVRWARANGDAFAPHPNSTCGISDGDTPLAFELESRAPIRTNIARRSEQPHISVMSAITGLQGMGKSTVGVGIARRVSNLPDVAVWCVDPSGVHHKMLGPDASKFGVLRLGEDFKVNPWAPVYLPGPVTDAAYLAESVDFAYATTEVLAEQYERHDSRFLQHELTKHLIQRAALTWNAGQRDLPSYSTLVEAFHAPLPENFSSLFRLHKVKDFAFSAQGVVAQVSRLTHGFFDASQSNAMQRLLSRNLILDVSHVGADELAFFLLWLFEYLHRYADHHGWRNDGRLRLFLLLDDLQHLFFQKQGKLLTPLVRKLVVLRQRGVHLCCMAHNFSALASIARGNLDLVCHVGPLADAEDRRTFFDWAGVKTRAEEFGKYAARIPCGEGILRHLNGPYPRPMAVKYPKIPKQDIEPERIEQARRSALEGIRFEPALAYPDLQRPTAPTRAAAGAADTRDTVRLFLESVAKPNGWTKPQCEHLINAGIGNSKEARERLLQEIAPFVKAHQKVNIGIGGGATLYELNVDGWHYLGRAPQAIPGKGFLPHKFYQQNTADVFYTAYPQRPKPKIEHRIGKHSYDLIFSPEEGVLLGMEIAASEKDHNEAQNAVDGFLPHTSTIHAHIVLAATDAAFTRVTRDLHAAAPLSSVRSYIFIERIGQVWKAPRSFVGKWLTTRR